MTAGTAHCRGRQAWADPSAPLTCPGDFSEPQLCRPYSGGHRPPLPKTKVRCKGRKEKEDTAILQEVLVEERSRCPQCFQ